MSVCWQHCGSANWRYTTVGISWHLGERPAADRKIISTGAAAQWELSTAAVMLLGEQGLQGLVGETFTDIVKIIRQNSFLYATHLVHIVILQRQRGGESIHQRTGEMICRNAAKMTQIPWASVTFTWSGQFDVKCSMWWYKRRKKVVECGRRRDGTKAWKGQNPSLCVTVQ